MAELFRIAFPGPIPELVINEGESVGLYGENGGEKSAVLERIFELGKGVSYRSFPKISASERQLFRSEVCYFNGDLKADFRGTVSEFITEHSVKIGKNSVDTVDALSITPSELTLTSREISDDLASRLALLEVLSSGAKTVLLDDVFGLIPRFKEKLAVYLKSVREERGINLVIASSDVAFIAELSDVAVILDGGEIVEAGPVEGVLLHPSHPYSRWLINASILKKNIDLTFIRTDKDAKVKRGCRYAQICPQRKDECANRVPEPTVTKHTVTACHLVKKTK